MDRPDVDPELLKGNLDDLRWINRWLGGRWLTLRALGRLTREFRPGDHLDVLDLATGGADIPRAIVAWGDRRRYRTRVVATDVNPSILRLASAADSPSIEFAAVDARRLPFADRGFDVVTCSLSLHHLGPSDAVEAVREMLRVARLGVIVNDLVRSWLGYVGACLLGLTVTRNPLTRHDGPLSVRRAYTPAEMRRLAEAAGAGTVDFVGLLGYRVAMIVGRST